MSTLLPPLLFFFFLLLFLLTSSAFLTLNDDVLGLLVFKAYLKDPNKKLESWNEDDENTCNWLGVKCDTNTNRTVELALDGFSLSGKLDRGLLQLQSLQTLSLSRNNFSGELNADLLQLKSLRSVDLSHNSLSGSIPDEFFEQCRYLRFLSLASNKLYGEIPSNVDSCSTLGALNLSSNLLSGSLPKKMWSLNALRSLDLSHNSLTGEIPAGVSLMFNLRSLSLRRNQLSGKLPEDFGFCFLLKSIDVGENLLSGNLPSSLQKLSLCSFLLLDTNSFTGELPTWVGEMKSLQVLDLSNNQFSGWLPDSIGDLQALEKLNFSKNEFTGSVPESMADSKSLLDVDLSQNLLTGNVPSWFFELKLRKIVISENRMSGTIRIPTMNSSSLVVIDLSSNSFSGNFPIEISAIHSLQLLNLSFNKISGFIPTNLGEMKSIEVLDLSGNLLGGIIPPEIGGCASLTSLNLSQNNLTGSIPSSMNNLTNLQHVDLSSNKLNGTLPNQLGDLPHLLSFNISHNNFSGELPIGNFFNTISPSSLSHNPNLCGGIVNRSCRSVLPKPIVFNPNSWFSKPSTSPALPTHHKKIILSISALLAIAAAAIIALGVITISILNLRVQASVAISAAAPQPSDDFISQSPTTDTDSGKLVMFSGEEPEFSPAAHLLFNNDCELGRGGFGAVYKAVLQDGRPVAIKKLTVSSLVKSQDEFEREAKNLGKIQHPNLVKLEGYYWTPSLQLLIYEHVTHGNLYDHLHESSESNPLSWRQRFNIISGIAESLAYLHKHGVIHYNLKSTNVLLDSCGDPKVADYGLAKMLPMLDRFVLSSKIGYMAPEFGCRSVRITEKSDVYGFGVLVLEIVTGRRPLEYMEDDVVVLCDIVRVAMEEGGVEEYVDGRLRGNFPEEESAPVIKLGLICTSRVPSSRPDMAEVVDMLQLIRCGQGSRRREEELC
ncbi:probable LRR receptor-like serine/threonine-protein kinase IRK [Phalaenopsis equestris]|uniref:probable LRR receptor-like serine/threonine-protein kinase IRK n=1 Tax=Phalaenopsis equestris TaxID=78828 RepID=UPI0009E43BA4|nr:probable LRR receptor-like serine/threonine-protein kinase IRK [Phalaenopsis equestris]